MKKQTLSKASSEFLGLVLLSSLLCTMMLSAFGTLSELFQCCFQQCHALGESLTSLDPHRMVFPR